jgi:hypothetical protein
LATLKLSDSASTSVYQRCGGTTLVDAHLKGSRMKKSLMGLAGVTACLACGWFGFWFGFTEMFFAHVDERYTSDAAELVSRRHMLRCLEEDPQKAMDSMREDLKIQRQIVMFAPPPVGWVDRLNVIMDPRVMWSVMQQRQGIAETRARMAELALDESRPARCGGRKVEG